jgi:hypothetical protein
MVQATPGAGDVDFVLGDDLIVLRPTLKAALKLSTRPGGLAELSRKCLSLDIEAISDIMVVATVEEISGNLMQRIFEEGVINLAGPCVTFINNLSNGGKPFEDKSEGDDKDGPLAKS